MKCYSIILSLLFSLCASAAEYKVQILGQSVVSPGDEVKAVIVRSDGEDRNEYFSGQTIDNILFVLSDDDAGTLLLVKPAPKKEDMVLSDKFEVSGAKFKNKKVEANYTIFENDFKLSASSSKENNFWIIGAALLVVGAGVLVLKKYRDKQEIKRNKFKVREKFLQLKKRANFEHAFTEKQTLIDQYQAYEKELSEFYESINNIQYKQVWTEQDLEEIKGKHQTMCNLIRKNDGV